MLVLAKVPGPQGRTVGVALRHCGSVRWGTGDQTGGAHTSKPPPILPPGRVISVSQLLGCRKKMAREGPRNLSISRVQRAHLSRSRVGTSRDLESDTHKHTIVRVTHARSSRGPMRFCPSFFSPARKQIKSPTVLLTVIF